MPDPRNRIAPSVEGLETRLAMSATTIVAPIANVAQGQAMLQAFTAAYLSNYGQPRYNPALDFNHNAFIGQPDANPILRGLAPFTPHIRQQVKLFFAPGDQVRGHHPSNSGGMTRQDTVTIIGKTTPNSIVFTDQLTGPRAGNYRFRGPAIAVDAQGNFSQTIVLSPPTPRGKHRPQMALTNVDYLIVDPFGHQVIRDFPIVQLPI
jgi:hypothetical protein